MNLTCGRNPWKRASIGDLTFRAYQNDPRFLRSILPISPELESILGRIFEPDPQKRIIISDLKKLILSCPRFTFPTPLSESDFGADASFSAVLKLLKPFQQCSPAFNTRVASSSTCSVMTEDSTSFRESSLSNDESIFSAISSYSSSSCGSFKVPKAQEPVYTVPPQPGIYHSNLYSMNSVSQSVMLSSFVTSIQVC